MPTTTPDGAGIACHIFFSDGQVELMIEPGSDTAAVGHYTGGKSRGEITWADGGRTKYSSSDGARYSVTTGEGPYSFTKNGSRIETCSSP